jgi:hypothetical protein
VKPQYEPGSFLEHDERSEAVTEQQALAWWPFRPLLRGSDTWESRFDSFEFVAQSPAGGTAGSPDSENTALLLVYQMADATIDDATYWGVIDEGGVSVRVYHFEPSVRYTPMRGSRPTVVRGRPAWIWEVRQTEKGKTPDWRTVVWDIPLENGSTIVWEVGSNPTVYDEATILNFTEDLRTFG